MDLLGVAAVDGGLDRDTPNYDHRSRGGVNKAKQALMNYKSEWVGLFWTRVLIGRNIKSEYYLARIGLHASYT
jgi:hypothetical protein